jgi:UDP-N-acetylmuramyl pentapeptide phosphotransferase/UDP-N-acetylglucosamine-1-phosphate transferase
MNAVSPALLAAVVSAGGAAGLLWLLLRTGWAWRMATDEPNHRSLHTRVTPRVGGWGMVAGTLCALVAGGQAPIWMLPAAGLVVVSFIDDRRGLSTGLRFAMHFVAAGALVALSGLPWPLAVPAAVLTVWLTNLYNFMDGSDGLAGGMALFGFGACALAAACAGQPDLALVSAALAGSAAGFLLFNLYPARVFMGDAGSVPLGFLAAALGLQGALSGAWPAWFVPVVFAPFIVDASVTLARRVLRGERFWQAHREHFYQRLVRSGLGHARTAWFAYALMLLCAATALAVRAADGAATTALLLLPATALFTAGAWIDRRWRIWNDTQGTL